MTQHSRRALRRRLAGLAEARATIADAVLVNTRGAARSVLGEITLLPHQQDAVARLQLTLGEFRGALLADEVGLGKTFVALAVATGYRHAHVIAPAGLLPMWRVAIARCGVGSVSVHSLQACSIRAPDVPAPNDARERLVIIDEAHHLRSSTTRRYRAIAEAVGGHHVLLLSATPVHNRPRDLKAQLALFLGTRSDLLEPALLSRLIVRRGVSMLGRDTRGGAAPAPSAAGAEAVRARRIPRIVHHHVSPAPYDPVILSAILALPAPLPARDGAVAGALVRIGILRAWCSSDAALDGVLTRRILRGSALRDALLEGRHPTNSELRAWVVGEHEVQLAFPALVASTPVDSSETLIGIVDLHVDALVALRKRHRRTMSGDLARVEQVRAVLHTHPGMRIVAFSQFSDTVRAVHRALSDIAGVGMLVSTGARIASGRVSRSDMLARFAPLAQGLPPPPSHESVRLLLSTDMLAEGVNLQDAGVVIHLDLPWTHALQEQRVGRAARLGSAHESVHVYTMVPPEGVEHSLRQLERLRVKALFGHELVGDSHARGSAADDASAVRAILQSWQQPDLVARSVDGGATVLAVVSGAAKGALVVLQVGPAVQLLATVHESHRSGVVLSDRVDDIRETLEAIEGSAPAQAVDPALLTSLLTELARGIRHWLATRSARLHSGASPATMSPMQRRVVERIHAVVAGATAMRRGSLSASADLAISVVREARGRTAERALEAWHSSFQADKSASFLDGWTAWPPLQACAARVRHSSARSSESPRIDEAWRIRAVILTSVVD